MPLPLLSSQLIAWEQAQKSKWEANITASCVFVPSHMHQSTHFYIVTLRQSRYGLALDYMYLALCCPTINYVLAKNFALGTFGGCFSTPKHPVVYGPVIQVVQCRRTESMVNHGFQSKCIYGYPRALAGASMDGGWWLSYLLGHASKYNPWIVLDGHPSRANDSVRVSTYAIVTLTIHGSSMDGHLSSLSEYPHIMPVLLWLSMDRLWMATSPGLTTLSEYPHMPLLLWPSMDRLWMATYPELSTIL